MIKSSLKPSRLCALGPCTVSELYDQFTKFSKSEVQHFRKLEQQRKMPKPDEAPRPHYNDSQCSYPKPVHSINSDGCGPLDDWEKNLGHLHKKETRGLSTRGPLSTVSLVAHQAEATVVAEAHTQLGLHTVCITIVKPTTAEKDCPIFLESKRNME
jgi:hypothetical protein